MSRLYDINYWDQWIGTGIFDYHYLKKVFSNKNHIVLTYEDKGVLVYKKIPWTNKYKILLLAKKGGVQEKGIGKTFMRYLEIVLKGNILILSDDTDIPNYYEKLGFSKISKYHYYYKWLLRDPRCVGYFKQL